MAQASDARTDDAALAAASSAALSPDMVSAGKLQVLSLDAVKDRLGDRWEKASERIRSRLEDGLRARMGPGDVLLPLDDSAFVVVFAGRSKEAAQLECYAAARDVLVKLFGAQAGDVQVRTVVGQVDGEVMTEEVDPQKIVDEALEREGDIVFVESVSPEDLSEAKAAQAEAIAKAAPAAAASPHVELRAPTFAYRPFWNYRKNAVFAYMCEADLDPRLAAMNAFDAEHEIAKIDGLLLDHVQRELDAAHAGSRRMMIYCPVHYSTLTHWRAGPAYFKRVREVGPGADQLLVWVVKGVTKGTPHSRLVDCVPRLAGTARATYCEVEPDDPHLNRLANLGVRALGMRWTPDYDVDAVRIAKSFTARAAGTGFATYACGLDTPTAVVAALAAGVGELAGAAIRPLATQADAAYRLSLTDLFSDPRAMAAARGQPPAAAQ